MEKSLNKFFSEPIAPSLCASFFLMSCILSLFYPAQAIANNLLTHSDNQITELKVDVGIWPPYILNPREAEGPLQFIVNKAFGVINLKIITRIKPWVRVEYELDQGHSISYGWIKNEKREKKWLFSAPISTGESGFFYRKSSFFSWKNYKDLKGLTIATARGYSYGNTFDNAKPSLSIFENAQEINSLKMLIKGRVDLVVIDPLVAAQLLQNHFTLEEQKSIAYDFDHPVKEYQLHLVCAKTWNECPTIIDMFNKGLKTLGRDYIDNYLKGLVNQNR